MRQDSDNTLSFVLHELTQFSSTHRMVRLESNDNAMVLAQTGQRTCRGLHCARCHIMRAKKYWENRFGGKTLRARAMNKTTTTTTSSSPATQTLVLDYTQLVDLRNTSANPDDNQACRGCTMYMRNVLVHVLSLRVMHVLFCRLCCSFAH